MKCPICEGKTKVRDSRQKGLLYRRRECLDCGERLTTYEVTFEELLDGISEYGGLTEEQVDRISRILDYMADGEKDAKEVYVKPRWSYEEESIVKEYYPIGGYQACLPYLKGRTKKGIKHKAKELGVVVLGRGRPKNDSTREDQRMAR